MVIPTIDIGNNNLDYNQVASVFLMKGLLLVLQIVYLNLILLVLVLLPSLVVLFLQLQLMLLMQE